MAGIERALAICGQPTMRITANEAKTTICSVRALPVT